MASTYTANSGIELIASGEQSGTWGTTTNTNLSIVDRLANGVGVISLAGTTHTLTTSDGVLSDGQYAVLVFVGAPSGPNTVTISPNDGQHVYIVKNSSGESVILTQGSGGNVTVANGDTKVVYSDGTGAGAAVVDITADFAMSSVKITGGSITGITDLAIVDGGTGASDASTARTNLGLAIGTNVQAYDAELTAIAALAVADGNIIVGNGTTWVAESGATARTSLGLSIGTDVQAYDAGLQSISGLTTSADQMIYTTALDTYATTGLTAAGRAILDDADASAQRTTLGVAIGTDVQAYDAALQSISGLTTSANQMIYTTALDTYATTGLTAAGRAILDDADASAQRTTLGLAIGTNVQAYDAELTAIAGLAVTNGNFIVGNGTTWVAESGATARTSLGLGTMATQAASSVTITGGSITGITDLAVADGGTGASDAGTARTNLGLAIGTNVQAYDAGLQSISALTTSADQMIYTTALDTYATTGLTAAGRAILDDADASAQRTTLGLAIGTNVQAYDAELTAIAGLAVTDGNIIVGNGTTWVAESGATARTSLGLAIGTDVQAYDAELTAIAALAVTDSNFIVGNGTTWVAESGATARTSLGLGTIATQDASSVTITGGTINGTAIGGSTAAAGAFTTVSASGDVTIADKIVHDGDTNTSIRFPAVDTVTVETAGVERLRVAPSGDVTFSNGIIQTVFALSGTTPALDPTNGTIQTWTLSASSSPTDSLVAGESLTLMIDDGTAYTITWPSVTWKTDGGTAPTLNTTGFTAIILWKVGSVLYGARVGNA
jgi:hypothetical protein